MPNETTTDVRQILCRGCGRDNVPASTDLAGVCQDCRENHYHECDDCGDLTRDEETAEIGGNTVCRSCRENYFHCDYCDEDVDGESSEDYRGNAVCCACRDDCYTCENCSREVHQDDAIVIERDGEDTLYYCPRCRGDRPQYRDPTKTLSYIDHTTPKVLSTLRPFGVEIEMFLPQEGKSLSKALAELTEDFGVGSDASIKPARNCVGVEIRTPPMSGRVGELAIIEATRVLRKYGGAVNRSCGLHIHLNAGDLLLRKDKDQVLKKLLYFYLSQDDAIVALLPQTRRGNNYAKILKNQYSLTAVENAKTQQEIADIIYYKNPEARDEYRATPRYNGINFHALLGNPHRKTLEIRYHSPTLSPTKILNWVALHQQILEVVPTLKMSELKQGARAITLNDKIRTMLETIKASPSLTEYVWARSKLFNPELCVA